MTPFSNTYQEARDRFMQAAAAQNLDINTFPGLTKGPNNESLYTDVAWYGPKQANKLIIINSGTHGVEGFCGSGCQVTTLEKNLKQFLPFDTALLFIHALNSYGFAWLRRTNEDNVDLNRNFVDHQQPYPVNLLYEELHPFLCLEGWDPTAQPETSKLLLDCCEKYGLDTLEATVGQGQYTHPDGVKFGGHKATWSNKILHTILATHAKQAEKVAFIDIHTGLGPYGLGKAISLCKEEDPAYKRMQQWFNNRVVSPYRRESSQSIKVPFMTGDVVSAVQRALPGAEVTAFILEFGTYPFLRILQNLCAENWLHFKGDLHTPEGERIKAQYKKSLYPDNGIWKNIVLRVFHDIFIQTLEGITKPSSHFYNIHSNSKTVKA